jgi:UDPglucose 6-dehydrogenase
MNDAVVIGYGVVGKATAKAFGITSFFSRSDNNISLEGVAKCRYIFICLPTPTVNGQCDTSAITAFIRSIVVLPRSQKNVFIIRSTTYPGYNRFLQSVFGTEQQAFVSYPEFLSDDTAEQDAKDPFFVLIGSDDTKAGEDLKAVCQARFKYKDIYLTDSITAEYIKVGLNNFYSLKVMFANEVYDSMQQTGGNYETFKKILERHPWGSKNHFTIEYKGKRGIHGKCLPKDLEAFATFTDSELFKTVHELNKKYGK